MPSATHVDPLTPYRRLVELSEHECALLQAGHLDQVEALQTEWVALMMELPATPPPDAGDLLRRAIALSAQAQQDYRTALAGLSREMGEAGHTRAVGRAYGGGSYGAPAYASSAAPSIDTAA